MTDIVRETFTERTTHFELFGRPWCLRLELRHCGQPYIGWTDLNTSWITPLDRDPDPRWPFYLMRTYRRRLTKGEAVAIIEAAYAAAETNHCEQKENMPMVSDGQPTRRRNDTGGLSPNHDSGKSAMHQMRS